MAASWMLSPSQSRKRARMGELGLGHEIAMLNESGVQLLHDGKVDEAQQFFVKALDCFIVKQICSELPHLSPELPNMMESGSTQRHVSRGQHHRAIELASALRTDPQVYDEGLYTYDDAMTLGNNDSELQQSMALYYNVAQTFLYLQQHQDAHRWLELALVRCHSHFAHCKAQRRGRLAAATVLVRIQHNMGYCHFRMGQHNEALDCFQKALDVATVSKLGAVYTSGARVAVAVASFYGDRHSNDEALRLLEECLVEYKVRFGDDSKEVATLYNNMGRVHYASGNCQEAARVYEAALVIRRNVLPADSMDVAGTICSAGLTWHHLGEWNKAQLLYEEFLSLAATKTYNARDVAIISKNLAEIYRKQKNLPKAKLGYAAALEAGVEGFGRVHPEVASILNRLGNLHYEMSDLSSALDCYKQGLEIEQLTLPPYNTRIVVTLTNIAQIHYQLGALDVALSMYKQVYAIQLQVHGADSIEVAKSLSTMGEIEYKMSNLPTAFALFQDVLVIQRSVFKKNDECLEIASTLNSIGIVACGLDEFSVAQSCFSSSLGIRKKLLGDHNDTATLWYNLATVNEEIGDDDVAISMYQECLRIEQLHREAGTATDSAASHQNDVVDSLQRLGRLHQTRGESDKALQCLAQALECVRARAATAQCSSVPTQAKFLKLIGNIHRQQRNIGLMMESCAEAYSLVGDSSLLLTEGTAPDTLKSDYILLGLAVLHPPLAAAA